MDDGGPIIDSKVKKKISFLWVLSGIALIIIVLALIAGQQSPPYPYPTDHQQRR